MKTVGKYSTYDKYVRFIDRYKQANNAASGSEVDANANVEHKNITTLQGELSKKDIIGTNRLLMWNKISEMYGEDLANEYIRQLEDHEIYKHDETSIMPYCVSITMYPFLFEGLKSIGGLSEAPKNLDSFCGAFINLVFAVASQFAGAVSTPEFLTYMDYFLRKEYGENYPQHENEYVTTGNIPKTLEKIITDRFGQVVYSLNQPAAARNYQSVFWNIAYFDRNYFRGIFQDFVFPDGTAPNWETTSWLQKKFMKWFNAERLKSPLTFPVETMNLLDDGSDYVDQEWFDFATQMYAEGHSFFTYRSGSVDSLSSCCFDGDTKVLAKSSSGVHFMPIRELHDLKCSEDKKNMCVYHNGSWVSAKTIKLPGRPMYSVQTSNKKSVIVTDNHLFPTLRGDVRADQLTTEDYILFNTMPLDPVSEKNDNLTYNQGFLVGMYLGDGSVDSHGPCQETVMFSLNKDKYENCIEKMNLALRDIGIHHDFALQKPQNNTFPVSLYSDALSSFIFRYVNGRYSYTKRINPDVFVQSIDFRRGILDGLYATDGGNSNRIYSTSSGLIDDIEALCASLGLNTVINVSDRTDEPVVVRGEIWKRNFPLYCIRWYEPRNKRTMEGVFRVVNNGMYFRVTDVCRRPEFDAEFVYCFEVKNQNEPYFTLPSGMITHNCRLRNELQDNTFSFTLGAGGVSTGSKGVITININRLVQNAYRAGKNLSDAVSEQVKKVQCYLLAFNEIMKSNFAAGLLPIYDAGYIQLEKQFLTIGLNGVVEGAEFLGIPISANEKYFAYCESILKPIYLLNKSAKTNDVMFNTEFVPAENLGVKNAAWDKKDGYFVPRDCYNSYFYLVEDEKTNLVDKFILHGSKLTRYLDGGSALHGNLNEHLTKEQYKIIMRDAIKTGCSYFTFNIPNTICNDCGHISKHRMDHCEQCGGTKIDYLTRVIGYLKRISAFSEARQKEAKSRYYE